MGAAERPIHWAASVESSTRTGRPALVIASPLALLVWLVSTGCVTPPIERPWLEVRSSHFLLWSALGRDETVRLARELEEFRQALAVLTSIDVYRARVPTNILLVPGRTPELGLGQQRGGFFRQGLRANWAVAQSAGREGTRTLYHEYVHFLMHNRDDTWYPAWFDEGFAELLATMRIDGQTVEVGRADPLRTSWLGQSRWIPYRDVIEKRDPWSSWWTEDVAMFYAQSWLLVHYLHWGRGDQSFGEDNVRFLELSEAGTPVSEAFELAFGQPVDDLDARISRYFASGLPYRRTTLNEPVTPPTLEVRQLSKVEVAAMLGAFMLADQPERARAYYEIALLEEPDNARALSGLGRTDGLAGRWADARPRLEQAFALAPEDPIVALDCASALHARAIETDDPTVRQELLADARRYYRHARAIQPEAPEALAGYGSTYLVDGEDPNEGVPSLEAAHRLLPGSTEILYKLAFAYASAGRKKDAVPLLERMLAWSHRPKPEIRDLLCDLQAVTVTPCT